MARLFFSPEATGPANQAQMQQGKPFLCPEGPQVDRRKVGQSNLNSAPKGGGGLKGQYGYEWSQKGTFPGLWNHGGSERQQGT